MVIYTRLCTKLVRDIVHLGSPSEIIYYGPYKLPAKFQTFIRSVMISSNIDAKPPDYRGYSFTYRGTFTIKIYAFSITSNAFIFKTIALANKGNDFGTTSLLSWLLFSFFILCILKR